MSKMLTIFLLFFSYLYASVNIDEQTAHINILPHSQIYVDKTNTLTLQEIKTKTFIDNKKTSLAYGFSPSLSVWVKFTLTNTSNTAIHKILQYNHEVTSNIEFYDKDKKVLKGLFYIQNAEFALSPTFEITLAPFESRTYYLKASSVNNFFIIKLELWDTQKFYKTHSSYQFVLALFFGAFGLLIIYNLFLFFSVKDKSYLWYVLYLFFVLVNLFFYKGLFYKFHVGFLEDFSKAYDITFPLSLVFLSLFIQSFLNTKQYKRIDKILLFYIISLSLLIVINFLDGFGLLSFSIHYCYTLVLFLFFIICYSVYQKNRQAYFIILGWLMMLISMVFVFFSTEGIYNFLSYYPYTMETGVFLEAIFEAKTKDLNLALDEKEILLRELLHRIKNNMQFIISLYALKLENANESNIEEKLQDVERKVLAMSEVHQLLYNQENIHDIEATQYFKKVVQMIQYSFASEDIDFIFEIHTKLEMEEAIYCGLIVNELVTNSVKYAFENTKGIITISLNADEKYKYLVIQDNGNGLKDKNNKGFGMVMIETLSTNQLNGKVKTFNANGLKTEVIFPKK